MAPQTKKGQNTEAIHISIDEGTASTCIIASIFYHIY